MKTLQPPRSNTKSIEYSTQSTSPQPGKSSARYRLVRYLLFIITVGVVATAGWVYWNSIRLPTLVGQARAEMAAFASSYTAEGFVIGKEYRLNPQLDALVVRVWVREGDIVSNGTPLVELDSRSLQAELSKALAVQGAAQVEVQRSRAATAAASSEFSARVLSARRSLAEARARRLQVLKGPRRELIEQALRRVDVAKAAHTEATEALARSQYLYERGVISKSALEVSIARERTAHAQLGESESYSAMLAAGPTAEEREVAESAVRTAESLLVIAEAGKDQVESFRLAEGTARALYSQASASVRQVRSRLTATVLVSPVTGVVSRVFAEPGMLGNPLAPMIVVSTREDLHIEAEVSTEDAPKLSKGAKVQISSPGFAGAVFPAHVQSISAVAELKPDAAIRTRVVRARVVLDDGKAWEGFKPGMEVDVEGTAVLGSRLSVPNEAVQMSDVGTFVFVLDGGKARQTRVQLGAANQERVEIIRGLKPGQIVATSVPPGLQDGAAVRTK